MTKAMEQALRLFLLEWLERREVALKGMIAGLTDRERDTQISLQARLDDTRGLLRTLREEQCKDWNAY